MEKCTFRPSFPNVEKRNRFAQRAAVRKPKAQPTPEEVAVPDEERALREKRRTAEKKRRKNRIPLPFEREVFEPVEVLVRGKRRA
jgi:hypothetical protein